MTQFGEDLSSSSESEFMQKFYICSNASPGVIHIRTPELIATLEALRLHAVANGAGYKEWDIVHGFRVFDKDSIQNRALEGDGLLDIGAAIEAPMFSFRDQSRDPEKKEYFVFVNPGPFMEDNPRMLHYMLMYVDLLPSTNISVLLVGSDAPIPSLAEVNVPSLVWGRPKIADLMETLEWTLQGVSDGYTSAVLGNEQTMLRACRVGAGMTRAQFSLHASMAITQSSMDGASVLTEEDLLKGIISGKTEVVNTNDLLELYKSEPMEHVGGLENLKRWVDRRKNCFSDEAKEFGIQPPKGIVLVGIPGTGKSLVAKAISSSLGLPLVRLDFGRVFNSLIGESERRMRTALSMLEAMAPVVLLCDEIDKGLGGAGGSGDAGTSSRVLGSFLSWLQDCKAPVFCVVTANNVTGLPPELLRRGRFDATFSTTMPTAQERREVLRIHLEKRGRSIDELDADGVAEIVAVSEGYVPAEIESCVKDGLIDAFSEGEEFGSSHIVSAIRATVPMSRSHAAQINAMREWAEANATPAGSIPEARGATPAATPRSRVIARTTRRVS